VPPDWRTDQSLVQLLAGLMPNSYSTHQNQVVEKVKCNWISFQCKAEKQLEIVGPAFQIHSVIYWPMRLRQIAT